MYEKMKILLSKGLKIVCCTITKTNGSVPRKAGSKMFVDENGSIYGSLGGGALEYLCIEKAMVVHSTRNNFTQNFDLSSKLENGKTMICGGDVTVEFVFVDSLSVLSEVLDEEETKVRVVVFGAGHVGSELVPVLEHLNFSVWLLDNRKEFVDPKKHPKATKCILCDYSDIGKSVQINENDFVAVMTHGHLGDSEILLQVMKTGAFYIGCIGSKNKVEKTKLFLRENGIENSVIEKLHSPIGLGICAETPQEIAISIAAELIYNRFLMSSKTK